MRAKPAESPAANCFPGAVSSTARCRRLNNSQPTSFSKPRTWRLMAACETCNSRAASVKLRRRAQASKARRASREGGRCADIVPSHVGPDIRMSLSYPKAAHKSFAAVGGLAVECARGAVLGALVGRAEFACAWCRMCMDAGALVMAYAVCRLGLYSQRWAYELLLCQRCVVVVDGLRSGLAACRPSAECR